MIAVVDVSAGPVPEVYGDQNFGTMPADGRRQVPAQRDGGFHHAVGVTEELHERSTDDLSRSALLLLSKQRGTIGRDGVNAGLPGGDQHVADLLALRGPAGDGAGRAVLE